MATINARFDGPIPGENYTSDVKNYPWHRPPEIVDHDEAVEYVLDDISQPEKISMIYTLLETGASVSTIVTIINLLNVSNGKYPIDLSILIAGPIGRFIEIMAKKNDLDPKLGVPEDRIFTPEYFRFISGEMQEDSSDEDETMPETAQDDSEAPNTGLMGTPTGSSEEAAPAGVQSAMLGYSDDEEVTE